MKYYLSDSVEITKHAKEKIKRYLNINNLTARKLGEVAGVAESTIYKYLHESKTMVDKETFSKLANAMGTTIEIINSEKWVLISTKVDPGVRPRTSPKTIPEHAKTKIRNYVKDNNLNFSKFAKLSDTSDSTVGNYCRANKPKTYEYPTLVKIAQTMGTTIDSLLAPPPPETEPQPTPQPQPTKVSEAYETLLKAGWEPQEITNILNLETCQHCHGTGYTQKKVS